MLVFYLNLQNYKCCTNRNGITYVETEIKHKLQSKVLVKFGNCQPNPVSRTWPVTKTSQLYKLLDSFSLNCCQLNY
ncbi:hypothetical protein T12_13824 [Trichinella patagoniensis]|uniref:Uncharacterized protein n=1 Tax=Trichinella patagoniensis TaxID=990121 RepID=A0A0V0ZLV0_9BILA|nr:hypothetical protein T12_13824 [Trichinella patagoniensis]